MAVLSLVGFPDGPVAKAIEEIGCFWPPLFGTVGWPALRLSCCASAGLPRHCPLPLLASHRVAAQHRVPRYGGRPVPELAWAGCLA